MKELDFMDYRLLCELFRNSRRSDRQLARVLKSSQPTVTRRRTKLEKEVIDGYTAIPMWKKLGYQIFAITLVKIKSTVGSKQEYVNVRKRGQEWLMSQHNIIMAGGCRGMRMDAFMISLHKTYSHYDEFMRNYRLELGDTTDDVQSVLINLDGTELLKPLNLKYLADECWEKAE